MTDGIVRGVDGRDRCWWPGADPVYLAYHDTEWGVPEHDGRALFEKLILDGFQAGLSWITILRKRDAFRRAFAEFDPVAIAAFGPADIERLMADAGIVRNRAKVEGTVRSAQAWLRLGGSEAFARLLWSRSDGQPRQTDRGSRSDVPAFDATSTDLSRELKSLGFTFCGPTVVYAFLQATGLINDHLAGCFRHLECARMPGPGSK